MKSKATLSEVTYTVMLMTIVSNIMLILTLLMSIVFPSVSCIFLLLFIVSAYLPITALKVVHKIDYVKAILLLIGTNIIMSFVMLILMAFFNAIIPPIVKFSLWGQTDVTEHDDGTFTIAYDAYGDKHCDFTFPQGWVIATEEEMKSQGFSSAKDYQLIYNENGTEYWLFTKEPPAIIWPLDLDAKYKSQEENATHKNKTIASGAQIELVDITTLSGEGIQEHWVEVMFPDFTGYEASYKSDYRSDGNFYFILENSNCYDEEPTQPKKTVENADGSLSIMYEGSYKGEEAACSITLPSGWKFPSSENPYSLGLEWVDEVYYGKLAYKESTWNDSQKEYLEFSELPPKSIYSKIRCEEDSETRKIYGEYFDVISVNHLLFEEKNAEVCEEHFSDESRTISYHDVNYRTFDGLGYKLRYKSEYGDDEDLGYVIENTDCYWK